MNREQALGEMDLLLAKIENILAECKIDYYSATITQHGEQKYLELQASLKIK